MSRANGYGSYRSSGNNSGREDRRPNSETLVDLHVYLVPQDLWRDRYNNLLNTDVAETVSAGIIRVHPEQKIAVLREEIDNQIGAELIPRDYVFLKSVGRSITKLKPKQEYQLKVKNFIPPLSFAPELYLLESQDIDGSQSSVRADSPEYNQENDNISRRSVGAKRSYNPSPRYNQYSPAHKRDLSPRHHHSPAPTNLRPNHRNDYHSSNSHRHDQNGRGGRYEEINDDPTPSRYNAKSRPREEDDSYPSRRHRENNSTRPLSASWGSNQGPGSRRSDSHPRHPPDEIPAPPLSATPPPLTEKHQKAPPRRETYTNHTNEDSGIEGLTPDDHYRENNYDDVLDRRKREEEEKRRREQELQHRLKAEAEEEERQRQRQEEKDRLEWERRQKEEAEKRQREEEERRKREEEERRKEEHERRLREEEREKMAQDKLSASDEKRPTPRRHRSRSRLSERSKKLMANNKDLVASPSATDVNGQQEKISSPSVRIKSGRQEKISSPNVTVISGRREKTGSSNVTVIVNVTGDKSDEQQNMNDKSSQDFSRINSGKNSEEVRHPNTEEDHMTVNQRYANEYVKMTSEQADTLDRKHHSLVSQLKEENRKPKEVSWSDVVEDNDRGRSLITTDDEESIKRSKGNQDKYDHLARAGQRMNDKQDGTTYSEFNNDEAVKHTGDVNKTLQNAGSTSAADRNEESDHTDIDTDNTVNYERHRPTDDVYGEEEVVQGTGKYEDQEGGYVQSSRSGQNADTTTRNPNETYKDHHSYTSGQNADTTTRNPNETYKDHHSYTSGYTSDISDSYQGSDRWIKNRRTELNRFPSPPPLRMSPPPPGKGDDSSHHRDNKADKEQLMRELEQAREARKQMEKHREDLVKKAKMLQNKMQNRRNHARDLWKKRYFEEKKRTSPLEEQCNRLRHELEIIHRRLMNTLEGPTNQKTSRVGDLKPSIQSNYKIQATRLLHQIDDIKRRLENAKMKLTAEMKLRNQAETELRAMRAELTQKKINLTLTRNHQMAGIGTVSVSDGYIPNHAITPRS